MNQKNNYLRLGIPLFNYQLLVTLTLGYIVYTGPIENI